MLIDIGKIIKIFAWLMLAAGAIGSLIMVGQLDIEGIIVPVVVIAGLLLSCFLWAITYGFGELVENSAIIAGNTSRIQGKDNADTVENKEMTKEIGSQKKNIADELKEAGLISQKEYEDKCSEEDE